MAQLPRAGCCRCEDGYVDFLGEALLYVLPLALAVVAGLISPALVTARKLRQDLAIDVELVDKLPTSERSDLSEEIKRRARRLIAVTRHPPVTLYDLLALLGLTAIVVTVIVSQVVPMAREPDGALIDPLSLGLPAIFAVSCWGAFYVPWATRAKARLEHIHSHLGDAEAYEAERTLRVALFAALLAGPGAILGMQVATAVIVYQASGRDWG